MIGAWYFPLWEFDEIQRFVIRKGVYRSTASYSSRTDAVNPGGRCAKGGQRSPGCSGVVAAIADTTLVGSVEPGSTWAGAAGACTSGPSAPCSLDKTEPVSPGPSPAASSTLLSALAIVFASVGSARATPIDYVIQISVDALRGDLLKNLVANSPLTYPNFARLQALNQPNRAHERREVRVEADQQAAGIDRKGRFGAGRAGQAEQGQGECE